MGDVVVLSIPVFYMFEISKNWLVYKFLVHIVRSAAKRCQYTCNKIIYNSNNIYNSMTAVYIRHACFLFICTHALILPTHSLSSNLLCRYGLCIFLGITNCPRLDNFGICNF